MSFILPVCILLGLFTSLLNFMQGNLPQEQTWKTTSTKTYLIKFNEKQTGTINAELQPQRYLEPSLLVLWRRLASDSKCLASFELKLLLQHSSQTPAWTWSTSTLGGRTKYFFLKKGCKSNSNPLSPHDRVIYLCNACDTAWSSASTFCFCNLSCVFSLWAWDTSRFSVCKETQTLTSWRDINLQWCPVLSMSAFLTTVIKL